MSLGTRLALSRFTAARIVTMSTDQFKVSSIIRGYKNNWSPFNGEELTLREESNDKDHYAVAVTRSGSGVVCHVPRRISAACTCTHLQLLTYMLEMT